MPPFNWCHRKSSEVNLQRLALLFDQGLSGQDVPIVTRVVAIWMEYSHRVENCDVTICLNSIPNPN